LTYNGLKFGYSIQIFEKRRLIGWNVYQEEFELAKGDPFGKKFMIR